ncbi:MAG: membrane protein insertion efficiency factor YidD [Bacteroidales bacterium]|nr:membrane protein insertion efficiency factor YidD [Bacteroidales bacterium]MCF8458323.1 membrane protein insertion efficiency factor YidD [Bacteroidales bacterium]
MKKMTKLLFLTLLFGLFFLTAFCQQTFSTEEKDMLAGQDFDNPAFAERNVKYGFGNGNKVLDYSFGSLMYVYQKFVSRQISASCLYSPSCSGYSKLLFKTYNPGKAFLGTIDRLMRCDRISATDLHISVINPSTHKKHEGVDFYGKIRKFKND